GGAAGADQAGAPRREGGVVALIFRVRGVERGGPVIPAVAEHGVVESGRRRVPVVLAVPAGAHIAHPGADTEAGYAEQLDAMLTPPRGHVLRHAGQPVAGGTRRPC